MAVMPLIPKRKMGVGKLISLGNLLVRRHIVSVHNYVRNFDVVPCIWSRQHDKEPTA